MSDYLGWITIGAGTLNLILGGIELGAHLTTLMVYLGLSATSAGIFCLVVIGIVLNDRAKRIEALESK